MSIGKLCSSSSSLKSSLTHRPTTITLSILETQLQKCKKVTHFNQILSQMILTGYIQDTYATSRLLKFSTDSPYINIDYSRKIFKHIESCNAFTWNSIIRGYSHRNCPRDAICLYRMMLQCDVLPDTYTYPILLQASTGLGIGLEGKQLHNHVVKMGFEYNVYVVNTLINMYCVCGSMVEARKVFDESPVLDSVSWNSILAGYVQMGKAEEAKLVFDRMPERNLIASNSMIVLLGRLGRVDEASQLFDAMNEKDIVSWTALISCYEQNEMFEDALLTFTQMNSDRVHVDEVVVVSILSVCAHLSIIMAGELVHGLALKIGFDSYVNIQNVLIHMYATCGDTVAAEKIFTVGYHLDQISWNSMLSGYLKLGLVAKAEEIFNIMPNKDIVSWCAMISGYVQLDKFSEALELFSQMQMEDVSPDETTLVNVLSACAQLAALDQGKWIHTYINKNELTINVILGTTLVDMYMKCGNVQDALQVFFAMKEKGVSTWNALILGLAMNCLVERSLETFAEMKKSGIEPNEITFIGVLGACRHMGLVDEGKHHFDSMVRVHNIEPNLKHYGCIVDLLGRAGLLKEAENLIETMPMLPDVATWGALLGACKKHGNKEIGERIGRKLIKLEPNHDGFHVLLSNIYASKGNWNDVSEVRGVMMKKNVTKTPGYSRIEANGAVHEFVAGDKIHPRSYDIENMLEEIAKRLKALGYSPSTDEVFFDIDEEEKEKSIFTHSEKLAIAYGLIAISPPTPIRIIKNLRICNDCHEAMKLISRSFSRKIVVRDQHLFHHFEEGSCSCKEYW